MDWWQVAFFTLAGVFVFYQAAQGWRRGVIRQAFHLFALLCGYAAAWFGRGMLVSMLRPLGFPDFVLLALSGAVLAFVVFHGIAVIGAVLFKKTSQQNTALIRFGCGAAGALPGFASGLVVVWVLAIGICLLGTVAEAEIVVARQMAKKPRGTEQSEAQRPSVALLGLARMKHSMEQGAAGEVMRRLDPVPAEIYPVIDRIGRIIEDPESAKRFMDFPGVKSLSEQPKIAALCDNPEIVRLAMARNYFGLMKNKHLVNVANDPEVNAMIGKLEFQKALDYALGNARKSGSAENPH